ncbi:macrolide export ATP-binding/permease protein MacB [Clostridium pasteurianum DSM 525 = ATCC 6013]|uniref:MacB-like periplasmic core domain containing protein n=1 Tax=Clostridium pasteurianum DSM 525 = ATCC 6013 TaxID=1262449 RepID=A0A0H3J167_CLOPA|nr:ABC transporter permease [Clostridium pasteurianum]AJA47606.1 macrolide export ATP-binding/permease protein MacB [Clostridium pasteurianum DSM 525 = ATCC 6013]AJA51594.1 macrolide export ATP-binding/permease protein MacB [Clostridium pasteurianum DSM 525 = ATCC 6013]AOZ74918.1 macrolide ABC transporter permease [Clostridium pasteurianum DSM 525 = ATCC 6013]AOZ78713.1 macrolide ABC transporter permease [Clostridium pasteurianum]ELP58054.1 ABC transporter permease [Clostridium pasteurianum DS
MSFLESFKIALESIKANKMRSFLTMLGIIIGIASVIAIVSLGQGGQSAVTDEFNKIGATTVTVSVDASKAQQSDYINLKDTDQIKNNVDVIRYVSPVFQAGGFAVTDTKSKNANITGATVDYAYIQNYDIVYGRYYNEMEQNEGKAVAVIDENAAKQMFGYSDAVGKTMNIGPGNAGKKVTIIGIKASSAMFGGGPNNMPISVDVPISFLQTTYADNFKISSMVLSADAKDNAEAAGDSAVSILESRHNNRGKDVYTATNLFQQLEEINKVLGIFTSFIGAVAAISLLVGGIGVMNIMLVSVTERTREIGIRKAIGATTKNIMLQFLTESVIISIIGGIIGMIIGIGGAELAGMAVDVTPVVSPVVVILAILFSSAVGIFFGIYPAKKAAALDPIEALRYE